MQGRFLLNVVVAQRPSIFELLASKDQPLLVWRDAFFVLNLCLYVLDRVGRLDFKGNGLAGEGFHENLHDGIFCVLFWGGGESFLKVYKGVGGC